MVTTLVVYPGDGVTRQFTVPFDYLNRTFVHVYLNDGEETQGVHWRFISPTVIERNWAPIAGETLTIRRVTSPNRIVDFKDASVLRSLDLNTAQLQVLHIAEEAKDIVVDTISTNLYGNLDARWRRIVHVSNPVENGDALNYGTYKADLNGAVVARDRAEVAATKAEASAATAKNRADAADSYKVAAEGSATAAKASETTASTAATTATNAAAAASTSASKAETEALAAKGWSDTAKGHADAAKVSEDAAQNVVDNAVEIVRGEFAGYASDAAGSATTANEWANQAKTEADRAKTAADSVDMSVIESRMSALEAEDITLNSRVTTLDTLKLNKAGGEMTGSLFVRGNTLRHVHDNLDLNTAGSINGLNFEWAEGTGKTWDSAANALKVYHDIVKIDNDWVVGIGAGWKVNNTKTSHTLHLTKSGKLMVDRQEARYVKQSYVAPDNSMWARIWNDGWIEQGGICYITGNYTVTYPAPFASNLGEKRTIIITPTNGSYSGLDYAASEVSNTSFTIKGVGWNGAVSLSWFVCGF